MANKIKGFNIKEMLDEDLILSNSEAENKEEVLYNLSKLLQTYEYVNEDFYKAIIIREKKFPTGLITQNMNVAIPHADSKYVKKPGIAIASLKKPVNFYQMDIPDQTIEVNLIFMLAIKKKEEQVLLIKDLISAFQEPKLLEQISNSKKSTEIKDLLDSHFK